MAEPGDMIEIFRPAYSHWALFIGSGDVIHLTTDGVSSTAVISGVFGSIGSFSGIAIVKKEKLKEVALGDKWSVHNRLDNECETKSPDDIVEEAEQEVGKKMPYNLLTNNCQHFVTNLRYGKPACRQVRKMISAVKGSFHS